MLPSTQHCTPDWAAVAWPRHHRRLGARVCEARRVAIHARSYVPADVVRDAEHMAARREAQAAQRRLKGDTPERLAIDLASEAHDRLAMLAKNCLRKRDNSRHLPLPRLRLPLPGLRLAAALTTGALLLSLIHITLPTNR